MHPEYHMRPKSLYLYFVSVCLCYDLETPNPTCVVVVIWYFGLQLPYSSKMMFVCNLFLCCFFCFVLGSSTVFGGEPSKDGPIKRKRRASATHVWRHLGAHTHTLERIFIWVMYFLEQNWRNKQDWLSLILYAYHVMSNAVHPRTFHCIGIYIALLLLCWERQTKLPD